VDHTDVTKCEEQKQTNSRQTSCACKRHGWRALTGDLGSKASKPLRLWQTLKVLALLCVFVKEYQHTRQSILSASESLRYWRQTVTDNWLSLPTLVRATWLAFVERPSRKSVPSLMRWSNTTPTSKFFLAGDCSGFFKTFHGYKQDTYEGGTEDSGWRT
jgi:hypothetical protein